MFRYYLIGSLLLHLLLLFGTGPGHSRLVCPTARPAYFQLVAGTGLASRSFGLSPEPAPGPTAPLPDNSVPHQGVPPHPATVVAPNSATPETEAGPDSLVLVGEPGGSGPGTNPSPGPGPTLAPRPIYQPLPTYPRLARSNNWQGAVLLEAELRPDGRIGRVKLLRSSGYALLDREALAAVRQWRYHPLLQDGHPISGRLRIKIPFRLEG